MSWRDALIDAGIAYLIGILASAAVLLLLAAIQPGMSFYEIAGKIAVQAVPAGMGAVLAHSQLGMREGKRRPTGGGRATPAPLARVGATPSWRRQAQPSQARASYGWVVVPLSVAASGFFSTSC